MISADSRIDARINPQEVEIFALQLPPKPSRVLAWPLEVLLPFGLWAAQSIPLLNWLIDDAGISFVYARNLVHGHGLVSQASLLPVEGFSNPLWTFLVAPLFVDDPIDPTLRVKLLSAVLVLGSFFLLRNCVRSLVPATAVRWVTAGLLILLSLNTSFIVWSSSGLENPLSVFLAALLLARILPSPDQDARRAVYTGLVLGGLALTRPDAVVFLAILPVWSCLQRLLPADQRAPRSGQSAATATAVAIAILSVTFALRWAYFGALLPNTYLAKGGPGFVQILGLWTLSPEFVFKSLDLARGVLGMAAGIAVLGGTLFMPYWLRPGPCRQGRILTLLTLLTALAGYLLLPSDWMGEFRFGTSTIVVLSVVIAAIVGDLATSASVGRRRIAWGVAGCLLVSAAAANGPRLTRFASAPTVSFQSVADGFGLVFNLYADRLGITDASIACPDVGGTLYFSKHVVVDLGGLCHREIAVGLRQGPKALQDLVLGDLRPTFIHLHGVWSERYRLEDDPRFRRDYLPIAGEASDLNPANSARPPIRGDWVRRDRVKNMDRLIALRRERDEAWPEFLREARRHAVAFPRP